MRKSAQALVGASRRPTRFSFGLGLLLVGVACVVTAKTAGAYDRSPVTLSGLYADGWGVSITGAEQNLTKRYGGIYRDYCLGVIMKGDAADSWWVHGTTRYWDKVACFGTLYRGGALFGLIYDAKGQNSFTIYRLHGASVRGLRGY
jgi:hypothetical protein